jgi:hypothetical protein
MAPLALTCTVPWAGAPAELTVTVLPSASLSLASTLMVTEDPAATVALSATASGGVFAAGSVA